jgi:periplasmic mercuric ion binding protein
MKTTITVLALMFVVSLGIAQESAVTAASAEAPGLSVATIATPTIQCGMCVKTITKALTATEGVASATVDLEKKTTTVTYDAKKTDLKKLEKAIADAGYDANTTKREMKAYDALSPCCKMDKE